MIDFLCEHVADVGGLKCVRYRRELADELVQRVQTKPKSDFSEYYYTSDEPNQSNCWLPGLVGSHKTASPWHLQFLVPKEFMVLASGKSVDRSEEEETALY